MNNTFKKSFVLFLAVITTLCMTVSLAFASNEMALNVSSATVAPGETAEITLSLENNPGLASAKVIVSYDSYLTLTGVRFPSGVWSNQSAVTPYKNPQIISVLNPLSNVVGNVTIATLTFKVAENAPNGYTANIALTYDEDDFFNVDYDNVPFVVNEGAITVQKQECQHSYTSTVTNATCLTDGYTTHTCSLCGDVYTSNIVNATGHKETTVNKTTATCTATGYTGDTICSVCKTVISKGTVIEKTAHSYQTTTTDATCIKDGKKVTACTACGDVSKTEIIKATGHKEIISKQAKDATCTSAGNTIEKMCEKCGAITVQSTTIKALGHKSDNGTIVKDATCTSEGSKTYKCTVCGETIKTEKIAKLNHTDNNNDGICDECGDFFYVDDPSANCSCNCHKSGFMSFIWKIQRFFWKLFSKNKQYCACGVKHW